MNTVELIMKKKEGKPLSYDELEYLVMGFTRGEIPDYQMSAFLMAVCLKGLDERETVDLTGIMRDSGDTADLSGIDGIKIDKHSTGGVGDKTTLILSPIVAACGVPVAKMSGRGLGFTGGTIDKLESIPGFLTTVEEEKFYRLVNENGLAVIGQTAHIAPADKKIYALRDVTGTVDNLSLITSSIMSKKLASGADGIMLDVKCGSGAFMKTEEDAIKLADSMVRIGKAQGKIMRAMVSDMNQPLGRTVGNSIEVREAIEVLKGKGEYDITEISVNLAGHMINMAGKADSAAEGIEMAREALGSGAALERFRAFVKGQDGDPAITDFGLSEIEDGTKGQLLPLSECMIPVKAEKNGFVTALDALTIGEASQLAGAGRMKKEDNIDHGAGILLDKKIGDEVKAGDVLCRIYASSEQKLETALKMAQTAYEIGSDEIDPPELIRRIIE